MRAVLSLPARCIRHVLSPGHKAATIGPRNQPKEQSSYSTTDDHQRNWTIAVLENLVVNPHKPFEEYSASSTYIT